MFQTFSNSRIVKVYKIENKVECQIMIKKHLKNLEKVIKKKLLQVFQINEVLKNHLK